MLKNFIKKYWLILVFSLLINIPIVIMGTIRTNKEITLKGDTQNINNFIQIETEYEEAGSFSSIYVVNFERSTVLQNLILSNNKEAEVSDLNINYNKLSDAELYEAGQIQKNSSISKAIIVAYETCQKIAAAAEEEASVNIDYKYSGLQVTYYSEKSALRVGDIITKINDITIDAGQEEFRRALITHLFDDDIDKYTVLRGSKELVFTEEDIDNNNFYVYDIFDINYETIFPKINVKNTNVGGPSGGLMQTLAIFNKLYSSDYSKGYKIAGTGTINLDGTVGKIGGIKQKIYTAYDDKIDIFFCPEDNYEEALEAYNTLKNKDRMALIKVTNFWDAIYFMEWANAKKV